MKIERKSYVVRDTHHARGTVVTDIFGPLEWAAGKARVEFLDYRLRWGRPYGGRHDYWERISDTAFPLE